jgi:lysophospholipase L1-like esterase
LSVVRLPWPGLAGLALLGSLADAGAALARTGNVERCLAVAASLDLGAPLPRTRAKLRAGKPVTVVALGSSSTSGFGTLGPGYPAVMRAELSRLRSRSRINVINRGDMFDTLGGNIARLERDVLRHRPDLVIWQLGTNDVLWRGITRDAERVLREGVRRLQAANAEVILMDLQDAPALRERRSLDAMQDLIATVARGERAGLFPRHLLMQRARAQGITGLLALDGLHNSGDGYRCLGRALARMIAGDL